METLALKYRPRTFEDLTGQDTVQVFLRKMVATRTVPAAMLYTGSRGTGKTTTARIIAASLNCESTPVPCGHCVSCKSTFDGTSLDVLEIDAASNGLVDNIRDLRQQIMYSVGGAYRIVILDEAHSMSTAAFNALLKTLEEPPPNTVFILCTTEPRKIPDTVASRCMPFTFRRLTPAHITARLAAINTAEQIGAEPGLLAAIAETADGAMRDAIMTLDQLTRAGITTTAAYRELIGDTDTGPVLLAAIATGDPATAFTVLHDQRAQTGDTRTLSAALTATLRDVLVLTSGGTLTVTGHALAARQDLARRVDKHTVIAAMRMLFDLKTTVGDDGLDLIVGLLTDSFTPTTAAQPAAPTGPAPKLNLAQMGQPRPIR